MILSPVVNSNETALIGQQQITLIVTFMNTLGKQFQVVPFCFPGGNIKAAKKRRFLPFCEIEKFLSKNICKNRVFFVFLGNFPFSAS